MLYSWQKEAAGRIKNKNAILSAPTGSGKTKVAYVWAGLIDENEKNIYNNEQRIIFTAPIKALSNERYLDLKKMGFDVGLETGDFKKNTDANIICCTQEIYTRKYAALPNQKVIIDEFHYISTDPQRARSYIDGIKNTNPKSSILIMSATFGHLAELKEYLKRLTDRDFELYHTDQRATKQVFLEKPVDLSEIHDALVFVFSYRGAAALTEEIAYWRSEISSGKKKRLKEIAELLSIDEIPSIMYKGVGMYVGSLLPKEKLFMETAFRERIIDVIVGTDALSLGINLPAETVVFAQLAKYYDGPISKNEFLQMSGRAGRKGYFDTGYITYYPSDFESYEYDTEQLYFYLLNAPQEPMEVKLDISIPELLRGKPIDEEAEYVAKYSMPPQSKKEVREYIEEVLSEIEMFQEKYELPDLKEVLADTYFPEYNLLTNLHLARTFITKGKIEMHELKEVVFGYEKVRNEFYGLLQLKKYINSLPERYQKRVTGRQELEILLNEIDPTVTKFEDVLNKIDNTKIVDRLLTSQTKKKTAGLRKL